MKTFNLKMTSFQLIIIFIIQLLIFHEHSLLQADVPKTIGSSNRIDATKANNGRRIIRSLDGDLFVVYMDSLAGNSMIWGTFSTNEGLDWSEPFLIDSGNHCSCAIAKDSSISKTYICYTTSDGKGLRIKYPFNDIGFEFPFREIRPDGAIKCEYPAIEATTEYVHVVWQQSDHYNQTTNIYYQRFSIDLLDSLSPIIKLSSESCDSKQPVIAGDLEYQPGLVHILWTDYPTTGDPSHIKYTNFKEEGETKFCLPQVVPDTDGCMHPSISTRNNYYGENENASHIVVAYSDSINKEMKFSWIFVDTLGIRSAYTDHLSTTAIPVVSVDDLLPFEPTCSIVWQDNNDIYYTQTFGSKLIVYPPILISTPNNLFKKYPNVCYKTYNEDFFDVIWTEGNDSPFKIMFVKREKLFPNFAIATDSLPSGVYKQNYYSKIRAQGYYQNYFLWKKISGKLPPGLSLDGSSQDANISGVPVASGTFKFTITLGSILNEIEEDTANYTIKIVNTPPQITSPDFIKKDSFNRITYQAQAIDAENNPIFYEFKDQPSWLTPLDSIIIGDIPYDVQDTSFNLIASDEDMADTLSVKVIVNILNVEDHNITIPQNYQLLQNYPNPFNSATKISFTVPQTDIVSISVYDINGKLLFDLLNKKINEGFHSFIWDASNIPSGLYFINMAATKFNKNIKCIVLK